MRQARTEAEQERPQEAVEQTQGQTPDTMPAERESAAQTLPEARETWDTAATQATAPEQRLEPAHERGGLRVVDRESGLESSVSAFAGKALDYLATQAEGLIEGMASLFDGGSAAPQRTAREPPRAPKSALQALQERAARERALRNLSKSLKRGDDLNAADLRALPPAQLERLRDGGDEVLQNLVRRWEREERERDGGRERER